jgi:cation diffusion facilitator CzcD-associated flavoprotein CzcO
VKTGDRSHCEVAVVGAGPYGLAVAAHLRRAGVETRVFGDPMSFWRKRMPKGMYLRSPLSASSIADPGDALTLDAYARKRGLTLAYPLPLDEFLRYAQWRLAESGVEVEARELRAIEKKGRNFRLSFVDGAPVSAYRVVIATGLANQEHRPASFLGLPRELVSHSCEHEDFAPFAGKRVAVVGAGQSGCESAALLSEAGADVDLFSREPIRWIGSEGSAEKGAAAVKDLLRRLTRTKNGVGPFPLNHLADHPDLVRHLPDGLRGEFTARCLLPAVAGWVKPRLGNVSCHVVESDLGPEVSQSVIRLRVEGEAKRYDHVLLSTGYRIDIARLGFLAPELLRRIRCADGSPVLATGFESTVRGLHFVGSNAVYSFGPLMRFVAGTRYAARHLTQAVVARRAAADPQDALDASDFAGSSAPSSS